MILFSIIWIVRPISYDEMRIRHPNNKFEFLESTTKKIILVKDTSGSFFAEGFTPPLPRRPSSTESQTATSMNGQNPGQGGGNPNPGSGSEAGSCSLNPTPTPKAAPESINYVLGSSPKTKKQKVLEKIERELKESYKLRGFLSALYFECEHFETNFDEDELYTSIRTGF